jgi:hypothetical protein
VIPDQCGFGRRIQDLPPGDREIVEQYAAFLRGDLDLDPATNEFVPPGTGVSRAQLKERRSG